MTELIELIKNHLDLDEDDIIILSLLQKDPEIKLTEIAKVINKSQPTVGARLRKLKTQGIIKQTYNINFKNTNFTFAQVNIQTSNTKHLIDKINNKIGKILVWLTTGKYNLNMLIYGKSIKSIENKLSLLFKNEECMKKLKIEFITDMGYETKFYPVKI